MITRDKWPLCSLLKLLLSGVLLLHTTIAASASFQVSPVSIIFKPGSMTDTLTITNESTESLRVQLEAKAWAQDETGKDNYTVTSDIIFFPKILTIDPNSKRVVRVGYQAPPPIDMEKSYRLFAQELPVDVPGDAVMKLALTVSIPVLAPPPRTHIDWGFGSAGIDELGIKIPILNKGNRYVKVNSIVVSGLNREDQEVFTLEHKGWYILAGLLRNFAVPIDQEQCGKASSVDVSVTINEATQSQRFEVTEVDCKRIKTIKKKRKEK